MISPDTIALVKERTDLVALIGESVRLTKRGRSFVGLCPFHKEKSPSFHVNADRGFFHCFGCKESGGAVDFMMKTEGYSFPEAIRLLAERSGIEVTETLNDAERREAGAARKTKDDLYAVNNLAATFFERSLRGGIGGAAPHPLAHHALEELARRGLAIPDSAQPPSQLPESDAARIADTLQAFRIGYAPFGWDGLTAFMKQQGISPVMAESVGLLVPRSSGTGYYDRFRHRLMFAVTDVMGRVIAFSGRALPEPSAEELARAGLPPMGRATTAPGAAPPDAPAKYINSPESPIYTKGDHLFGLYQARHAVRREQQAVLVEGNFDVVALHARGLQTAVAPLGTAFTEPQAKLLKRFAPNVIVLFDGDVAGRKATRAARVPCRQVGLSARVGSLPNGVDPDDFARKHGVEGLERILKGATGMLEYFIREALDDKGFEGATWNNKLARVRAVAALLGEEDDPNLRAMAKTYADRLSSQLVVLGESPTDLRELELIIEQSTRTKATPPTISQSAQPHDRARSRSLHDEISLAILGALIDFPFLLADPGMEEALVALDGDAALAAAALRQATRSLPGSYAPYALHANSTPDRDSHPEGSEGADNGISTDEFLATVPHSIHSFAVGRLASPMFEQSADAKSVALDNAKKLKRSSLSRENARAVDLPNKIEAQGDIDAVNALLLSIKRTNREKRGLS